ncbi:hypothetical protein GCM10009760_51280 [Kitasatospora kazusensis]|uniref:Uncharacterized protein n=1 Tax=Kitasatospora kazusensis TaxID=407974 RepID=A0ABN3A3Z9_9ACTN
MSTDPSRSGMFTAVGTPSEGGRPKAAIGQCYRRLEPGVRVGRGGAEQTVDLVQALPCGLRVGAEAGGDFGSGAPVGLRSGEQREIPEPLTY